jgi:CDP-diacylglycerol--serine O-phosphatidyltransferase
MRIPRLPDLLTTANLCCGAASILLVSEGELTTACWLLFVAALFDVFDGLAARAMGGGTAMGTQLDSLADMVSFGVAPAVLVHAFHVPFHPLVTACCVWLAAASCWRLAKFNVDTRQSTGFLGLPTPANGLFWSALVLAGMHGGTAAQGSPALAGLISGLWQSPIALPVVMVSMGLLLVSELPLPSLKFKSFAWRGNEVIFLLLALGAGLVLWFGMLAVPLIMILYLLSPLWGKLFPAPKG